MRNALLCLIGSVALVVLSIPLARTFFLQVEMIVPPRPGSDVARSLSAAAASFGDELQRSAQIMQLWRTLGRLSSPVSRPDDQALLANVDPANGLRAWLELLLILRREDEFSTTRPVDEDMLIMAALGGIRVAPPIRLYVVQELSLAQGALAKVSPRQRAAYATYLLYASPEDRQPNTSRISRIVLSELVRRLESLAERWQEKGKRAEAQTAREAIIRLMTEVVTDSPTPEWAMLTSELMIPNLRTLGASEQADRLETFRQTLRAALLADETNIIPHTGCAVMVEKAHDRLMRSMTATLATMATWAILAAVAVFLMAAILVTQPPDEIDVQWRRLKRGPREAALLACSPLLGLLVFIVLADIPWTWLVSYPTLKAALILPGLLLISIGAATWISVRFSEPFKPCPLPGKAAWAAVAVYIPTLVVLAVFVSPSDEPWQPPVFIQRVRLWGPIIGGLCLALAVVWLIGGVIHRTRTGLPAGVWARANLATVASALLLTSLVLWAVLAVNQYCDIRHERAFVEAMADPVADKLGPDWLDRYFPKPVGEQVPTTSPAS
ncbi:MAG: hypothetical protein ACUVXJ_05075 [Phycisphaerae bacterium]